MRRRPTLALLGLTVTAVTLTACTSDSPGAIASAPVSAPSAAAPSSQAPEAPVEPAPQESAAVAAETEPSPSAIPAAPAKPAFSYDVTTVQRTLTDSGYYVGPLDGKPGAAMSSAVMAFQKVNGLGADGTMGPATLAAMAAPRVPVLTATGPANRVEVDLTKQVLYIVKNNAVTRIMPVSSGNGATYAQKDGSTAKALTPTGYYTIERRIVGERKADLGTLYDPQYFYRGWAIHGSNSVPAVPASHGCVRVTRADAKYLLDVLRNGMTVFLHGGTHTFAAGSKAAGTDNPTGDTPGTVPSAPATTSPAPQPASPSAPASPKPASPKPATSKPAPSEPAPSQPASSEPAPPASETSPSPKPTPSASPTSSG